MSSSRSRIGPRPIDATSTKAIIKKGPQGISGGGKNANERTIVLASTQRAIRLRNGKGGTFGTGELTRISGREKLELIAEDEMARHKAERRKALYDSNVGNAIRAPFNMEQALKVAQSQMDLYIDTVNEIHNKDLCYDRIKQEIEAQAPKSSGAKDSESLRSASFVAEQFGVFVHNAYMMASGWSIIYESLNFLSEAGLADRTVAQQLKSEKNLRLVYSLSFALLKKLVDSGQQRLRSIVQNTEHFRIYFRTSTSSKDQQEFDDTEMRKMYKSFLDSTIIELCLPRSVFTPQALYSCLHAIEEESPRELKRCPQLMWDAVGDLSEAVRLLDLMETPLLNEKGQLQLNDSPEKVPEFNQWERVQEISIKAALQYSSFVNLVYPLENLQNANTLNKTWEKLNANYIKETGANIDSLWQVIDVRHRIPHFSILHVPSKVINGDRGVSSKKPLAIKENAEDSDSVPSLVSVSDSEEEYESDTSESSFQPSDFADDGGYDEAYDSEEEEELKKLFREAMNLKTELADELDPEETSKAKNPFLKLLGHLKGRLFSPSSALRTDGKTTATSRPAASKTAKKKDSGSKALSEFEKQFSNFDLDQADDESDDQETDKKKKKKPKKKKKKKTAGSTDSTMQPPILEEPETGNIVQSPITDEPIQMSPIAETPSASSPPASPVQKKKKSSKSAPSRASTTPSVLSGSTILGSTTSLPLPTPTRAQSARSYLKNLGASMKEKVKTRPDQPNDEVERRMTLPRLDVSGPGKEAEKPVEDHETGEDKDDSVSAFSKLKNKTSKLATRFFGIGESKGKIRWEQFLQIMRELGFEYDPSTAGSSVRFDPPNPNDRSITFHKPHPDPTLYPYKIKEYRDKLQQYYDWTPDKFQKAMEDVKARGNV